MNRGRRLLAGAVMAATLTSCGPALGTTAPTSGPATVPATPAPTDASATGPVGSPPAPTPTAAVTHAPLPTGSPAFSVTLKPFASVEGAALAIAAPDDGTRRLFVAAQDGRIWVVKADGTTLPDPLVDLRPFVKSGGEQGLLGLALHPGFPTVPRLYVDYTNTDGDTIVASLTIDPGNPNRAAPGPPERLLFQKQPYANHNGGALAFGPDGDLYVSLGDGGSGGDPQGNGQNTNSLLGKILRVDVDSRTAYGIPAGNPFAAGGGAPEIWLYGLRNPWRMSFDRATGDLWIGDVGQSSYEEVDIARAGIGGLNFGWNRMEATHCFQAIFCSQDGLTPPVAEYGRDVGSTVIGGYVYRGAAYPIAGGFLIFADYGSGRIFAIGSGVTGLVAPTVVGNGGTGTISAFGQDAAGELYVTGLDGTISKVVIGGT